MFFYQRHYLSPLPYTRATLYAIILIHHILQQQNGLSSSSSTLSSFSFKFEMSRLLSHQEKQKNKNWEGERGIELLSFPFSLFCIRRRDRFTCTQPTHMNGHDQKRGLI
jgi:hypothetical protein